MYDYYLGGGDNFPADRDAAEAVITNHPQQRQLARNNRGFLARAVAFLAEQGIDQFVDIGTGIPTSPNVHEVARASQPDARIVYVDNDPVVLAHARALLAADDQVGVVDSDMHDLETILGAPETQRLIDFSRPVAVLFVAVLHFSPGDEPQRLVRAFRDRMVAGSYLVASLGSTEGLSDEEVDALHSAYAGTRGGMVLRSREAVTSLFDGLDLQDPGVVDVSQWRGFGRPTHVQILAGVGRRP